MVIQTRQSGIVRAVVFDFDGVLVDSEEAHGEALRASASALGLREPGDCPGWYIGLGDHECFWRMAEASGRELDEAELKHLIERKGAAFEEFCRAGKIKAFPGAVELLRAAATLAPIAVCSGSRRGDIVPSLEAMGVRSLLKTLVTADDVARTKPDPEPYLLSASQLGVAPEYCIAIEDSPAGIAAARAAGYGRVHAVCHTFERRQLAEAHEMHNCIGEVTAEMLLG